MSKDLEIVSLTKAASSFGSPLSTTSKKPLAHVTKPNGKVFLMCFSDEEPHDRGPRRIRQDEIRATFADGWTIESITPSEFEPSPNSERKYGGGPKAWFAVIRRVS